MQMQALLLLSLLTLHDAETPAEPKADTSSSESSNGLVSYILTYNPSCELARRRGVSM